MRSQDTGAAPFHETIRSNLSTQLDDHVDPILGTENLIAVCDDRLCPTT